MTAVLVGQTWAARCKKLSGDSGTKLAGPSARSRSKIDDAITRAVSSRGPDSYNASAQLPYRTNGAQKTGAAYLPPARNSRLVSLKAWTWLLPAPSWVNSRVMNAAVLSSTTGHRLSRVLRLPAT